MLGSPGASRHLAGACRLVCVQLVCLRVGGAGLIILPVCLVTGGRVLSSGLTSSGTGGAGRAGCSAGRHLGQADSAQRNSDR